MNAYDVVQTGTLVHHAVQNSNINLNTLYTHGNVDIHSTAIRLGDLVIALTTGTFAYLLLVGAFVYAFVTLVLVYYQNDDKSALDARNLLKFLFKPTLLLISGLLILNILNLFLHWYNIDLYKEIQFFFEARYDILTSNIQATHKLMPFAQSVLIVLDLVSKFAFWSLVFVHIFLYISTVLIMFAILVAKSKKDNADSVIKKVFAAGFVFIVGIVSISIFDSFANHVLFKENPNIQHIGVVADINDADKKSFKYFANLGLNGLR